MSPVRRLPLRVLADLKQRSHRSCREPATRPVVRESSCLRWLGVASVCGPTRRLVCHSPDLMRLPRRGVSGCAGSPRGYEVRLVAVAGAHRRSACLFALGARVEGGQRDRDSQPTLREGVERDLAVVRRDDRADDRQSEAVAGADALLGGAPERLQQASQLALAEPGAAV